MLGICYGMQTMASQLGGKVEGSNSREFGYAEVRAWHRTVRALKTAATPKATACSTVWMSHGDGHRGPGVQVMEARRHPPRSPAMADESWLSTPSSSTPK